MKWNHPQRSVVSIRAGLLVGLSAAVALPAVAINRSWDDAGGSASKLWSDFGNWSPDGSPAGDDIFIGNFAAAANDLTVLDQAFFIDSLTLSNGADVITSTDNGATNDFQLTVTGLTTIGGAGSTFFVIGADGDGLDTRGLTINSGGTLNLNATTAQGEAVTAIREGFLLDLNAGGTVIGTGRIDFDGTNGAVTTVFRNDGALTANRAPAFIFGAPVADTLRISDTGDANARFDWDGNGNGTINVNGNQTLDVDISTGTDAWSGTMNLNTGSTLDMRDAWSLDSGTINVNTGAFGLIFGGGDPNPGPGARIDGANWTMTGGTIELADDWDTLILDSQLVASGGTINNNGTIVFNGGASIFAGVDFNMIGSDASLTINSAVNIDTPDFNLDGTGFAGNVTTINAGGNLDLDLGAGADEDFNHTINMNGGELDVTTLDNDWSLSSNGNINAAGGVTSFINGETFNIAGDIDVSGASQLNINAVSSYSSLADVSIGAGSTLNHGTVTYNGGSYTGAGIFRKGSATIAGSTTWDVATVDIDDGTTTINNGATLTVNTDAIDSSGDGIDSTITIADTGRLTINLSAGNVVYDSAATINYNGNAVVSNFLNGSDIDFNGTMNITGDGRSTARLNIGSTGEINLLTAGDGLRLGNSSLTNTIAGGTVNGPGTLFGDNNRDLSGFGTLNSDIQLTGAGSELIATGGILTINGDILAGLGTLRANAGSNLTLNSNFNSANTSNGVSLNSGVINGVGTLTLTNRNLRGNGSVQVRVINSNQILAQGGTLTISNVLTDLDGTGSGILRADSGTLRLVNWNTADNFDGTAIIDAGSILQVQTAELVFGSGGTLQFDGGTYRLNVTHEFAGNIVTNANSSINTDFGARFNFAAGSDSTINHTLSLISSAQSIVRSGATLSGGGDLRITPGTSLNLDSGATVNIIVTNDGNFGIAAAGVGAANAGNYDQLANGIYNLDITGTNLANIDRLIVAGSALLDGELDVDFSGFAPTVGDLFPFLTAGFRNGTFSTLDVTGLGAGLDVLINYTGTSAVLEIINAITIVGDYNGDGFVSQGDLDLVLLNWGDAVVPGGFVEAALPGGGPFDSLMSQNELDGVLLNWGNGTPPAVAIPEPSTLVLLGVLGLFVRRKA